MQQASAFDRPGIGKATLHAWKTGPALVVLAVQRNRLGLRGFVNGLARSRVSLGQVSMPDPLRLSG